MKLVLALIGALCAAPAFAADMQIFFLQSKLNALGYETGKPDGVAGSQTRAAIAQAAADLGFEPNAEAAFSHFMSETFKHRQPLTDDAMLEAVKKAVGSKLKDPFSAQYEEVFVLPSGSVCGKVNAKNSYGAYSGWEYFHTLPLKFGDTWHGGVALIDDSETMSAQLWCMIDA